VPLNLIQVLVKKGWLTLEGKVDWAYQKQAFAASVSTGITPYVFAHQKDPRVTLQSFAQSGADDLAVDHFGQ
jgi:hypothetical protein